MLTDDELAAIAARADRATPGPWRSGGGGVLFARRCTPEENQYGDYATPYGIAVGPYWRPAGGHLPDDEIHPTAEFIAAAREDVPALLAEMRRLRAEHARYLETLAWYAAAEPWQVDADRGGKAWAVLWGTGQEAAIAAAQEKIEAERDAG